VSASTVRLDLPAIDAALRGIQDNWADIDAQLQQRGIGRKDPFTSVVRNRMLCAYRYLDELAAQRVDPLSKSGAAAWLELNNRVHYGTDAALRKEFAKAIEANNEKYARNVGPIVGWCEKHTARGDSTDKLAAEVYVSVLGQPQLFIEGNHRTGSLIASWINLAADRPPFVLSVDNAIAYFAPSAEIKHFADRSTWRGRRRLPKYRKVFCGFWQQHVEEKYLLPPAAEPVEADAGAQASAPGSRGMTSAQAR
jgi:hypothetical protein